MVKRSNYGFLQMSDIVSYQLFHLLCVVGETLKIAITRNIGYQDSFKTYQVILQE